MTRTAQLGDGTSQRHELPEGREAIAIVGIGCRFARSATPAQFFRNLVEGMDAITEVPKERFDADAIYDPRPGTPGRSVTRWGSFVDDVYGFDPYYFGLSPREANTMDPQQRLLLEVTAEALDDAGLTREKLSSFRSGVFIGACHNDWENARLRETERLNLYTCTGSGRSILAGRISYAFNLLGPSMAVDAGCASSLLAVHLACQSLWSGESSVALAGGVNLILEPEWLIVFSQAAMLSPDGRCKAFDARANGFVRSDGCGVVALMPLSLARSLGARVYAVIRGSGTSNDGSSNGLLATPSQYGQEKALRAAYDDAALSPHDVQYVECHGTGTPVGDPVEVAAIVSVMKGRDQGPCAIGSVKTNIGHTEGAAGIAGLIKAALSLHHRVIPASLHFETPNPKIAWDPSVRVASETQPWPEVEVARAGVNSFGISGTDVHVVLEQAPAREEPGARREPALLCLSHGSDEGLRATAASFRGLLEADQATSFHAVAQTAALGRNHHEHRLALVARDHHEAVGKLRAFCEGDRDSGVVSARISDGERSPVFVFSGQGGQWVGMGASLLRTQPVFRDAIERCDEALRPFADFSVLRLLSRARADEQVDGIDIVQPTLFAMQVGLAALYRSYGVQPSLVIGHSVGEIAAAHTAGILTLDQAARVVCRRSQLLKRTSGQGAMLATELTFEQAQQAIARFGGRVGIAVSNGPTSTVLSGEPTLIAELKSELEQREVFCRPVKSDVAGHSPQLDPLLPELAAALAGLKPEAHASVPFCSTVVGGLVDASALDASYWVRNLREPVRFSSAMETLLTQGHDTFVELNAHPLLVGPIEQLMQHTRVNGKVISSLHQGREDDESLLASLGALHVRGQAVDLASLFPAAVSMVSLPPYVWQHERLDGYEPGEKERVRASLKRGARASLLGRPVRSALHKQSRFYESELSLEQFPHLDDHRVRGVALLPGAGYVEMALAAASELLASSTVSLSDVRFDKALPLRSERPAAVQLIATRTSGGATLRFFGSEDASGSFEPCASMRAEALALTTRSIDLGAIRARLAERSVAEHFRDAEAHGIEYGPAFRGIEALSMNEREALAHVVLPAGVPFERESALQPAHAALLDACWQSLAALLFAPSAARGASDAFLPVGVRRLAMHAPLGTNVWAHAVLHGELDPSAERLAGDVLLTDEHGRVLMEVEGLEVQRLGESKAASVADWLYEVRYESAARRSGGQTTWREQTWLVLADRRQRAAETLLRALREAGARCVVAYAGERSEREEADRFVVAPRDDQAFAALVRHASDDAERPLRGVVQLWALDSEDALHASAEDLSAGHTLATISTTLLVQALARGTVGRLPPLWLVTRGAQPVNAQEDVSCAAAPLWALGRVLRYEFPELDTRRIDLGAIDALHLAELVAELRAPDVEDQVALRGQARYVARLARRREDDRSDAPQRVRKLASSGASFRLTMDKTGILDNLRLREIERAKPAAGEVEIEVEAAGLNFLDVMKAMGIYPGLGEGALAFGLECAGRVTALGEGVSEFALGQEVLAVSESTRTSIAKFVVTKRELVVARPRGLTLEQSVTIPVTFLTAYYALCHVGRMDAGERVLVHSAAGGVGLAAVQLALAAGAEVVATAGSEEKREFVQSLGVAQVFDSRADSWADDVRQAFAGEGVDLVLNSLAGDAIPQGVALLRPYGRFLEIGKRDLYDDLQLGLLPFKDGLSFAHVDVARLIKERPKLIGDMLRAIVERVERGELKPLPTTVYPVSQVGDAFRYMAQGKHVGKVVLTFDDPDLSGAVEAARPDCMVEADATYLVTGGLSGLGLLTADFLVREGAKNLVLIGRRAPSEQTRATVERFRDQGVRVVVRSCDVSREREVAELLADITRELPPLRGIIHSAGVLDDATVTGLTPARFDEVWGPKALGAFHLHRATQALPLRWFVLYSSAATTLGSPGQANYAAANEFLDALAHHRRAFGLPALSINWGPWLETGLAVRADRGERLGDRGLGGMTDEQGLSLLRALVLEDATHAAVLPSADFDRWSEYYPVAAKLPMFEQLRRKAAASHEPVVRHGMLETVRALPAPDRSAWLESYLLEQVAKVLKIAANKQLDPQLPLTRLGIDSLMAIELKNRIQADLTILVPVSKLLLGASARKLAGEVLERLEADGLLADAQETSDALDEVLSRVAEMSEAEVDALLNELAQQPL
jgi:phthiocerol/phenolphthiocerol synthesis type-I polyketide synthase C